MDFTALKEDRNTASVNTVRSWLCGLPAHGVSRAERVSSGNGWHTTNAVSVVCYTATPQTAKTGKFSLSACSDKRTGVSLSPASTLRCCGVPLPQAITRAFCKIMRPVNPNILKKVRFQGKSPLYGLCLPAR